MKGSSRMAMQVITSFGLCLAVATAFAQPAGMGSGMMHGMGGGMGPGMMHGMGPGAAAGDHGPMAGPMAMLTKQDAGSAADMGLVHDLLANNARIKRTVTNLPNGIKTVTESDDPQVAQAIKAHVASMSRATERRARIQYLQHHAAGAVRERGQDQVHGRDDGEGFGRDAHVHRRQSRHRPSGARGGSDRTRAGRHGGDAARHDDAHGDGTARPARWNGSDTFRSPQAPAANEHAH